VDRDLVGYGENPPRVGWPGGAQIAVSLVVNYEEGSEPTPANGDPVHETRAENPSTRPPEARNLQTESQWEYGARAGVWRLLRLFAQYRVPATFFVSAQALERNPSLGPRIAALGHTIGGHGYRWLEQWHLDREAEREVIRRTAASIERLTGRRPLGWFSRSGASMHTREILAEEGFLYDSEGLNDDLPYYTEVQGRPWLVVPYAFDTNDGKYWRNGWNEGGQFLNYLKDSFDQLYQEGRSCPRMLTVALHSRISGRPGRTLAVARFIEYAQRHPGVWFAGRDDIAHWWLDHSPPDHQH
jgi:peptidoglycan/xylan/chitin deacetylase (PgdA/CDA1 family)